MLWAVIKLYFTLGRNANLKEFFSQKMIILHVSTFFVYLIGLVIMYIYNSKWDTTDREAQNKVFSSFAVAMILLFFVQLVLIYIFFGLGRAPSS